MKPAFMLALVTGIGLSSAAWAQSSLSDGPVTPGNSGSEKSTKNSTAPVAAPTPSGEGSSTGMSGSGPTAPQEKQDLRSTGDAPSMHHDPGEKSSPPATDK